MALIKTPNDLALIRVAGQKLATILENAEAHVQVGMTTAELNSYIQQLITEADAKPSFLGYDGFPASSCTSVNDQVVHGIPGPYHLKEGDLLGIDVGIWYKNVCVDGAVTCVIGKISEIQKEFMEITQEALKAGIKAAKPFRRVGAISHAIEQVALTHGLGIVRALTGHGVGHQVHESPEIPNYGKPSDGILLKPGMVLAIEPMFTLGKSEVLTEIDGWGIVTADKSLACHFEHTVIITNTGAEVVTRPLA